ncbi:hypothetical protein [Halovenus salina]|uniref:Protein kinase domain-containing protein n=1 Tax=Halovenus salina TaxID=1510225 RepID=A0ABD5W3P5_9EURY|nr:hypothetical protein [Halovenus salina]
MTKENNISRSDVCGPRYVEPPPCNRPLGLIKKGHLWVIEQFCGGVHDGDTFTTHSTQIDALQAGKNKMEADRHPCLLRWDAPNSVGRIFWNSAFEELTVQFDPLYQTWVVVPDVGYFVFARTNQYQDAHKYGRIVQEEFDFKHLISYDQDGTKVDSRDHRFLRNNISSSGVRFTNTHATTEDTTPDDTKESGISQSETTYRAIPKALAASLPDITKVEIVDDEGVLYKFDSPWESDTTVRILSLSPEQRSNTTAVNTMSTIIESWSSLSETPYVSTVLDSGFQPTPWVVYESQPERLTDIGHDITIDERLSVLDDVSSAIMSARNTDMTPLGIRPKNVYLRSQESGYRGTFANWGVEGLVKKANNESVATPFTAPEQIKQTTSTRTPVYQLGALAYWLFCETTPFRTDENLAEAIQMGDFISPTVAGNLQKQAADALTKAMKPHPEDRFETVDKFYSAFCTGL